MAMDQYLLIPFLGGWTSIYQLFWCELQGYQGFDPSPYGFMSEIGQRTEYHKNVWRLAIDFSPYADQPLDLGCPWMPHFFWQTHMCCLFVCLCVYLCVGVFACFFSTFFLTFEWDFGWCPPMTTCFGVAKPPGKKKRKNGIHWPPCAQHCRSRSSSSCVSSTTNRRLWISFRFQKVQHTPSRCSFLPKKWWGPTRSCRKSPPLCSWEGWKRKPWKPSSMIWEAWEVRWDSSWPSFCENRGRWSSNSGWRWKLRSRRSSWSWEAKVAKLRPHYVPGCQWSNCSKRWKASTVASGGRGNVKAPPVGCHRGKSPSPVEEPYANDVSERWLEGVGMDMNGSIGFLLDGFVVINAKCS